MTNDPLSNDPLYGMQASREARYVFAYLSRCGGSMRLGPMLRHLDMEPRLFVAAVTELVERYWVVVHWRKPAPGTPDDEPRLYTEIDRLCATRFGRRKYRSTWPEH